MVIQVLAGTAVGAYFFVMLWVVVDIAVHFWERWFG